jgi:hypothetical protein
MRPKRDVGWRQLCAIATHQLQAEGPFPIFRMTGLVDDRDRAVLSVDWFEWAERIKCRLVRLRLNYPDPPQQLTKAMEATHRSWEKREGRLTIGPVSGPRRYRQPIELPNLDPPWPRTRSHTGNWTAVSVLTGVRPSCSA